MKNELHAPNSGGTCGECAGKAKRNTWKPLLLALSALVVLGAAFWALDGPYLLGSLFTEYDQYEYTRTGGGEVSKEDLARITAVLSKRAEEIYPNGRGYGLPKMSLGSGRLKAKALPDQTSGKAMRLLMSRGLVRLLDEKGKLLVDTPEILSAEKKWINGGRFALNLTLNDAAAQRLQGRQAVKSKRNLIELDGRAVKDLYSPAENIKGNVLTVALDSAEVIGHLAAAINHPLDIGLAEVPKKENESGTASKKASGGESKAGASGTTASGKPKLAEGETYYSGKGKLDYCESVTLGFVLSADGKEVRDITISIVNLTVTTVNGNTRTTRKVGSATTRFSSTVPVKNGTAEVFAGQGNRIVLSGLGAVHASCELTYSFTFHGTPSVTVNLGSTRMVLKSGS